MKNHWSVHVVRATVTIWQKYAYDDNVHIDSIRFDQSQSKKSRQYWNGDTTSHLHYSFPNVTVLKVFAQRSHANFRFDSKTGIGDLSGRTKTKTYDFFPRRRRRKIVKNGKTLVLGIFVRHPMSAYVRCKQLQLHKSPCTFASISIVRNVKWRK